MGVTYKDSLHNVDMMDQDIEKLLAEANERLQKNSVCMASELTTHSKTDQILPSIPKLSSGTSLKLYVQKQKDRAVIDTTRVIDAASKYNAQPAQGEQKFSKSSTSKKDKPTAGSDWFDLPKTELTPELLRDLQLLRMRSILDPKRHYKKENGKAQAPKYSQVGTIIEGPTEFFGSRIVKRNRKRTFVDEALAAEQVTKRFETKYRDIQDKKKSGKKSFYKTLRSKRKNGGNRH